MARSLYGTPPKRSAKAGSWRSRAAIFRAWQPAGCTRRPSWRVRRALREGRYKDDVPSFWYHGHEVHLRSQRTKGFQESIFNDEIKGAFDIELWRELDLAEREFLEQAYAHLSVPERKALMDRLTRLRTGEMQSYYIMRYGFYEGHTEYRVDPIAIAALFGLKSLTEIEKAFRGSWIGCSPPLSPTSARPCLPDARRLRQPSRARVRAPCRARWQARQAAR
jgi:hypothetical protein